MPHFTPLVISAMGGLASEASTFYKKIGLLACLKMGSPLQQQVVLAMLQSGFLPLMFRNPVHQRSLIVVWTHHQIPTAVDLINVESNISPDV